MHEFTATVPFDLYELHLLKLVVAHASFTRAAVAVGLTQSALTRQIQRMERRLGVPLLTRTTRSVIPTEAGAFLLRESAHLVGDVGTILRRVREEYAGARREVRVGVSRSVALAYLPGFFHANLRAHPNVACRVVSAGGDELLPALERDELDLAVLNARARLPRRLQVTHRFQDAFTLIAPRALESAFAKLPKGARPRLEWLQDQSWLLLAERSGTARQLRAWMIAQHIVVDPVMQLDSFDLIINLVSLGMGISFVPIRALALYGRRRDLCRLAWPARFSRELAVVIRKQRQTPDHLTAFVEKILF